MTFRPARGARQRAAGDAARLSAVDVTRGLRRLMAVVVVAHLVIAGAHGVSHLGADVDLSTAQMLFVLVVITVAPFVGLYLDHRGSGPLGAVILVVSMVGSLAFGWFFHFVADTPDNVARVHPEAVGSWAPAFVGSAYVMAAVEILGTLLAVALLGTRLRAGRQRRPVS